MNDRVGFLLVQIEKALQDLLAPSLYDPQARILYPLYILSKIASSDHLGDKGNLYFLFIVPCCKIDFRLYSLSLFIRQSIKINNIPGDLLTSLVVNAFVHDLVCAPTELLPEALESTSKRCFDDYVGHADDSAIIFFDRDVIIGGR